MSTINFHYKSACLVHEHELTEITHLLQPIIEKIKTKQQECYNSDYAFLHVPFDEVVYKHVRMLVEQKKILKPTVFIVIGIGGSNLGTIAIHEALQGTLYNLSQPVTKVYFADTVDADYIHTIHSLLEQELKQGNHCLLNIVSKSGTTTETIVNFEIFLQLLQQYNQNISESIVITTDKNSPLWHYGNTIGCTLLEIPKLVGGRYSVFTAVGLFPLALLDINITQLMQGARQSVHDNLNAESFATLRAALLYAMYRRSITMHDLFVFSKNLAGYSYWYRQLLAESLGKEFDVQGKRVNIGITPTVSIGTTDLHSVAQLYLSGAIERFTTFVIIKQTQCKMPIPMVPAFSSMVPFVENLDLSTLMSTISMGVRRAYQKKARPFCTLELKQLDAYSLGYLLQMHMIEVILLGHLFEINPFDQPNVELYKDEVRQLLTGK